MNFNFKNWPQSLAAVLPLWRIEIKRGQLRWTVPAVDSAHRHASVGILEQSTYISSMCLIYIGMKSPIGETQTAVNKGY